MATQFKIYGNSGSGAINYAVALATVAGSPWLSPVLTPGTWRFGVRPYDDVTLLEDQNTDAALALVIDAGGNDVSGRPNAPTGLAARPGAAGGIEVTWNYNPDLQGGLPAGFHVYAGAGPPDYTTVLATVLYGDRSMTYKATLAGFAHGVSRQVGVRSYNVAYGEETNTTAVSVVPDALGPDVVEVFSASAG